MPPYHDMVSSREAWLAELMQRDVRAQQARVRRTADSITRRHQMQGYLKAEQEAARRLLLAREHLR